MRSAVGLSQNPSRSKKICFQNVYSTMQSLKQGTYLWQADEKRNATSFNIYFSC